jgi:hypothetical protein
MRALSGPVLFINRTNIFIINNIDLLDKIIDIFHIRLNQNCFIRKITGKIRYNNNFLMYLRETDEFLDRRIV